MPAMLLLLTAGALVPNCGPISSSLASLIAIGTGPPGDVTRMFTPYGEGFDIPFFGSRQAPFHGRPSSSAGPIAVP